MMFNRGQWIRVTASAGLAVAILIFTTGCARVTVAKSPAPRHAQSSDRFGLAGLIDLGRGVAAPLFRTESLRPGYTYPAAEELLFIERAGTTRQGADTAPRSGALLATLQNADKQIPVPLQHTDVKARIDAYIATVSVTQQFHNPYDSKIEAVYVFPLPQNAAVNEFLMTIGDRRIRGIIRERREAERLYQEARRQGHVASLLTQERANVFTQKVANIEPGKAIDINIKYFHTLAYDDGWFEFVFPMVVGPRFNPVARPPHVARPPPAVTHVARPPSAVNNAGARIPSRTHPRGNPFPRTAGGESSSGGREIGISHQRDVARPPSAVKDANQPPPPVATGIGAVARGQQGASGQQTEIQYLAPHERSGHDISLTVDINAGIPIEEIKCRSHAIDVTRRADAKALVRLSPTDTIPNKDFVLRYRVAGDRPRAALLTHVDERGGFFSLMVVPPAELDTQERRPLELIFVLDCSGSMSGRPIQQAKAAVDRALRRLKPDDTFQIIRFSNKASRLGPRPLTATPKNVRRGLRYLAGLGGGGGTMMIEGIKAALDFPHDESRLRFVAFLTDGFIGNEIDILAAVRRRIGPSRIFSFGVGAAPNRYLMNRMAKIGRGAVAYLGLDDSAVDVMDAFLKRVRRAALTDIEIDWGGLSVSDVYPGGATGRLPDLFVGRPVIISGRFDPARAAGPRTIRLRGNAGQGGLSSIRFAAAGEPGPTEFELPIPVDITANATRPALASVWARHKIADLTDRATYEGATELPGEIRQIALEYGLMSAYTAFVAVDSLTRTAGTHGTTVAVPVPVPKGVKYETTVIDR